MSALRARWARLRARGVEGGAAGEAVELAYLAPILLVLFLVGIAGGNIVDTNSSVSAAAQAAARAASLERDPDAAETAGRAAADRSLADGGVGCTTVQVVMDVDAIGTSQAGAAVTATVSCTIPTRAYAIPGWPGETTVSRTEISPVDVFREGAA